MKSKKLIISFFLIYLCCQIPFWVYAQMPAKRPIIGVVLSGGGAKGFAHVPALQMIDSLGIPVDYVAGTSMGAIIGGLYAIGYTPDQLEQMIYQEDWSAILEDAPLRRNIPIMEKDVKQNRLASIGIKTLRKSEEKKEIEVFFPTAYLAGQNVFDKILQLTFGYHDDQNFLSFPKGFLCVAADLETGSEVVMTSGSLPNALRSSMSIPTLFSPNRYEGKMLVDGGAINNLPSDHLKALGCDIIIGVNVSTPFAKVGDNPSIMEIIGQTAMFSDSKSAEERKALCDVLVEPDISEYGVTSFGAKEEILKRGYEAARKALPELQKIAERVKTGVARSANGTFEIPDSIVLASLTFKGMNNLTEKYLGAKFNVPVGQKINYGLLDTKNKELFGTGRVVQSHFFLYKTETPGSFDCEVVIEEKKAETVVGVGLHYDSDLKAGILLSGDIENLFFKGSKLLANFVISERPRLDMTYLLDAGRSFSFGLDANMRVFTNSLYKERNFIGRYQQLDIHAGIYALQTIENSVGLKLGVAFNHSNYNIEDVPVGVFLDSIGNNEEMHFEYEQTGPFMDLTYDRLDDAYVPKKGIFAQIRGDFVMTIGKGFPKFSGLLDKAFISARGQWKNVWPITNRFTIVSDMNMGVNLFNRPSPTYFHILGGAGDYFFNNQKPFLGYRYQEVFISQIVATGALDFRYRMNRQFYGSFIVNAGIHNMEWDDYTHLDHLAGWGLKVIWMTPFGPVSGTLHSSFEDARLLGFISIGFNI
ncbi:MAG: patatin-like phospholipase family protein [Saprospiraceae bacterium]|nr:patatin-like phospholipase family protein [Saprospiraceae bacterium]MCB9326855.1 patatin-like phospholipase family protein [Lewinellaceae bacterium]